jgi:GNAT superfamily N-acetyltransferase
MHGGERFGPKGMLLRRLVPGDAEPLAAFYNGLSAASKRTFRPLDVTTSVERCEDIVRANVQSAPTKYDLVAVDGATIVGWSFLWDLASAPELVEPRPDGEADREVAPTFGLAVADAYQGQGLGSALISRVMTWARDAAIPVVLLTVVQDNAVAWRLYERAGFARTGAFVGDDGLPYYRMRAQLGQSAGRVE